MIPDQFEYRVPDSIDAAVALLAEHGEDAKVLTGGHSLLPMMKLRLARPEVLIDLRKLTSLRNITRDTDTLEIGATATHAEIERSEVVREACPLLAEVAGQIGDVQVRNVGTIGGSLAHADPASDWPAAMLACGATIALHGPAGERTVSSDDFFVGLMESAARPDEILTHVRVPACVAGAAYEKIAQSASGFALAGVAVQVSLVGNTIASAHVGITGVADRAYRPAAVESALAGCPLDADAISAACASAPDGVDTLSDIHASARYRDHLARVLTRRAVLRAAERAGGGTA